MYHFFTFQWLLKKDNYNREASELDEIPYNPMKAELLKTVYSKMGCQETVEGALECLVLVT